jgi:hypothetical protein
MNYDMFCFKTCRRTQRTHAVQMSDMAHTERDDQHEEKSANAPTPTRYRFRKSNMQVAAIKVLLTYTHFWTRFSPVCTLGVGSIDRQCSFIVGSFIAASRSMNCSEVSDRWSLVHSFEQPVNCQLPHKVVNPRN